MTFVVLLAIIALVLFVYVLSGVKIVRPYQKGLVEQLGELGSSAAERVALCIGCHDF